MTPTEKLITKVLANAQEIHAPGDFGYLYEAEKLALMLRIAINRLDTIDFCFIGKYSDDPKWLKVNVQGVTNYVRTKLDEIAAEEVE